MAKSSSGTVKCGWCLTGHHDSCKPSLTYYDKTWYCVCEQCHPDKEKKDEVVEEPMEPTDQEEVEE